MTSKAYIAYDNALTRPDLDATASSERAGFSAVNAWDWRTTTYWSPDGNGTHTVLAVFDTAVTADYFVIYRHNLGSVVGTVKLQYSGDAGSTWTDVFPDQALTDNQLWLKLFASITSTHWRVLVEVTAAAGDLHSFIGYLMFGQVLNLCRGMPPGFLPPRQGRKTAVMNSQTEGGQFAGRAINSRGAATTISVRAVEPQWIRDYWEPFQLHGEIFPFIFSWNHVDRPDDACWCEVDGEFPPPGAIDGDYFQSITLPVKCLLSGTR